jgi:hypothetical protein
MVNFRRFHTGENLQSGPCTEEAGGSRSTDFAGLVPPRKLSQYDLKFARGTTILFGPDIRESRKSIATHAASFQKQLHVLFDSEIASAVSIRQAARYTACNCLEEGET